MCAVFFPSPATRLPQPQQQAGTLADACSKGVPSVTPQFFPYATGLGLPATLVIGGIFSRLASLTQSALPSMTREARLWRKKGRLEREIADCIGRQEACRIIRERMGDVVEDPGLLNARLQRLREELGRVERGLKRLVLVPAPVAFKKVPKVRPSERGQDQKLYNGSILSCDLQGFSWGIAQVNDPLRAAECRRYYLHPLNEVAQEYGGVAYADTGDGVAVHFVGPDCSYRATASGLRQQALLQAITRPLKEKAREDLNRRTQFPDKLDPLIKEALQKSTTDQEELVKQNKPEEDITTGMSQVLFLNELSKLDHTGRIKKLGEIETSDLRLLPLLKQINPLIFRMRVGVNSGLFAIGISSVTGKETVAGDTANMVSRYEQTCPLDRVQVSPKTAADITGYFEIEGRTVDPKHLKGVQAFVVLRKIKIFGLLPPQERLAAFQGRVSEMTTLQEAFQGAKEGKGSRSITIMGEAGIGKKRLVHEFLERASKEDPKTQVMIGEATPLSRQTPYHVIVQALTAFAEISDEDLLPLKQTKVKIMIRRALGSLGALGSLDAASFDRAVGIVGMLLDVPPEKALPQEIAQFLKTPQGRHLIFETLGRLFLGLAKEGPLLLVIKNIHQADTDSRDAIDSILRDHKNVPIMVLGLEESDKQNGPGRLKLEPLDEESIGKMVDDVFGTGLDTEEKNFLVGAAKGSPLLLAAIARDNKDDKGRRWTVRKDRTNKVELISPDGKPALPNKIREYVQARLLDRSLVSEEEVEVLQMASVICETTPDFGVVELSRFGKIPEKAVPLFEGLVEKRFLYKVEGAKERYRFIDEISRRIVYEQGDVRGLHSSYADALAKAEVSRDSVERAYHLEKGERIQEAAKIYRERGASAKGSGSYGVAAGLYGKAYELYTKLNDLKNLESWVEALFQWDDALFDGGRHSEMKDLIAELRKVQLLLRETDIEWRAKVHLHMGQAMRASAKFLGQEECDAQIEAAKIEFDKGVELTEKIQATPTRCRLLILLGNFHWHYGKDKKKLERAKDCYSLALKTAKKIGKHYMGMALTNLSMASSEEGAYSEAYSYGEEAIRAYRDANDLDGVLHAIVHAGSALIAIGDYQSALKLFQDGVQDSRERMNGALLDQLLPNCGGAARRLGQLDLAMNYFDEALPHFRNDPNSFMARVNLLYRALIHADQSKWVEAQKMASELLGVAKGAKDSSEPFQALANMVLANVHLGQGELEKARDCSLEAIQMFRRTGGIPEFTMEIFLTRAQTLYKLGLNETDRGNHEIAKRYFKAALGYATKTTSLQQNMGRSLSRAHQAIFRNKGVNKTLRSLVEPLRSLVRGENQLPAYFAGALLGAPEETSEALSPELKSIGRIDGQIIKTSQIKVGEDETGAQIKGTLKTLRRDEGIIRIVETDLGVITWHSGNGQETEYAGALIDKPLTEVVAAVFAKTTQTPSNRGANSLTEARRIIWNPRVEDGWKVSIDIQFFLAMRSSLISNAIDWDGVIPRELSVKLSGPMLLRDGILSAELEPQLEESELLNGRLGKKHFGKIKISFSKTQDNRTRFRIKMQMKRFTRNSFVFVYTVLASLYSRKLFQQPSTS